MTTLLITRPQQEAASLAASLHEMGFETFSEPMLTITALLENKPALEAALANNPQLLIATSRRAIEIFAQMSALRNIPLLTVGAATADYAASLGFGNVQHCETAEALPDFVKRHYDASKGDLLYLRGEDITVDITKALASFNVDSVILYRATPASQLSEIMCSLLKKEALAGALFFSGRTAATYTALIEKHGLADCHKSMQAICMSETIAASLRELPWAAVFFTDAPNMESMLATVKRYFKT